MIQVAWENQKVIGDGVSPGTWRLHYLCGQDFQAVWLEAIATVTNNPYQLATDIYGIGFVTGCDRAQHGCVARFRI